MSNLSFLSSTDRLPRPASATRARHEIAAWRQRGASVGDPSLASFMESLGQEDSGVRFLEAVFGNSVYLGQILQRNPEALHEMNELGLNAAFENILNSMREPTVWQADRARTMTCLRNAKDRAAMLVAFADIAGAWDLTRVTGALTRFAEVALDAALCHLLHHAGERNFIEIADPDAPHAACGVTILGMGKLGARELNYSSDIDLIVLFDSKRVGYLVEDSPAQFLHRLVRDLVTIMSERTRDGYVLRTDLRLRPDAGATPLANSIVAAEHYYESLGQNWERAAMIKARTVAGDISVGEEFLARITPFIWRKHLDFAAIQDIHSIKRQINAHKGHHEIAVAGHNIKLGRGGIREIEFFAQTQQLIWGGREPSLRAPATCDALRALAEAGRTEPECAEELTEAYQFLRRLEHRLQMISDEQTHTLPEDPEGLVAVARFMGLDSVHALSRALTHHLLRVEFRYADLFEDAPELGDAEGNLVFTGTDDDPDTLATLARLGYGDGKAVSACIRAWHHGRIKATGSTRARELLTELMPALLGALAKTVDPDAAFMKFNEFLSRLPAGIQLFSLFYSNPGLLDQVAGIMGSAPRLAEHLSRRPTLLDGVLTGDFYQRLPDRSSLLADLDEGFEQAGDFQDVLDIVRRWAHDREFQVGMQLLRGGLPGEDAAKMLADVADTVICGLLPRVQAEFGTAHGSLAGGEYAVLGMGKFGGREMTFESDLDLIYIYSVADGMAEASDGPTPLAASQYYARFSQRLTTALSAMTPEGKLYEIDTRLRPSGGSGAIASEIEGFEKYQREIAWTWEHMALTRARVVAGAPALSERINRSVHDILTRKREREPLRRDVASMRQRIDRERQTDNVWRTKHVRGGLLDLEFIAQYLQLLHAAETPECLSPATEEAFVRLGACGHLPAEDARALAEHTSFIERLQIILRLTVGMTRSPSRFTEGVQAALTKAAGVETFGDLEAKLVSAQADVRRYYERIVGPLDEQLSEETES